MRRKHCKVTAQADGTAEVACISQYNPTIVHRCAAHGGQPVTLAPGAACTCMLCPSDMPCEQCVVIRNYHGATRAAIRPSHVVPPPQQAGDKCIIQPGDRVVLLEAEGMRVPGFELHIGDSDAAPAAAGPAHLPAEPQPLPATPGNAAAADAMVPLATPPPALPSDAFDFVEPPAKR